MSEELDELKSELARLQRKIDQLESHDEAPVARRNMLRGLGAAATGAAVGGLAFARPAGAADPNDVVKNVNNDVTSTTRLQTNSMTASNRGGIFHVTNDKDRNLELVEFPLATSCITALADGTKDGGFNTILAGQGSAYGAKLDAPVPLKLTDSSNAGTPTSSGYTGQFRVNNGDLYFCTYDSSGGSAEWKRLTGRSDAGMFVPVNPFRVYESRTSINAGNDGPISTGTDRTISVANSINVENGAVVQNNAVPSGASAITFNIAIVSPSGGGFLSVAPSTATSVGAATINWDTTTPGALANGSLTQLGGDRQIKVFAGGAGSVDFVVDITGYYA